MIYISEAHPDNSTVILHVEGDLDAEYLPVLVDIYRKNLGSRKAIKISLEKISVVDRAGKAFLRDVQDKVQYIGMPLHIQIEIGVG